MSWADIRAALTLSGLSISHLSSVVDFAFNALTVAGHPLEDFWRQVAMISI